MSKDDINSLGSLYGGMLNGLKKDLIKEGKVGPGEIGDAALQAGGPTEEGGFTEPEVDVEKLSDKEKKDNLYDINKLSYTNSYMPEEDEEGKEDEEEKPDYADLDEDGDTKESMKDAAKDAEEEDTEEDEESSEILEKIAQDSLNNFMKQKSVFDKLYDKVMVNENFDEMESEDFDALGIEDATPDAEEGSDEVTVTLARDVAQALCDVLQAACGETDSEDADEAPEGAFGEEDEEGIDTGSTHSGKYDDGKNNKVGDLKTAAAASAKGADSKLDSGSHLNTSYDDGKNNKVGSLKTGDRAVD